MTEFEAAILARLDRIAAAVEARLPEDRPEPLLTALAEVFGDDWFTSSEVLARAAALAAAAEAEGLRTPDLPHHLHVAGIGGAHALGRWLAARQRQGVTRGGSENGSALWRVSTGLKPGTPFCGQAVAVNLSANETSAKG